MDYILQTNGLTKFFGKKAAVDRVSMHIAKGDIYGFIGKNGAGKTTTMKMVLGMLFPTAGTMELFGQKADNTARHRIGSLIEAPGLYPKCTAYENMKRFSILYGGDDKAIKDILELVGLQNTGKKKAGAFSLGMKQRLGIAIALLGDPEFLVLDEPVNGLDPAGIKDVRDTMLRINQERGVTVLISSHLLGELSKISTRYGIINNGVLVEEVTAKELESRFRQNMVIQCREPQKAIGILQQHFGVEAPELNGERITLYSALDKAEEIITALVQAGAGLYDLHVSEADMEDYFIERIGRS